MLFKHELLHLLIRKYWGMAPVLFWEGIPIYYSDYSYYLSEKKVSYHEICKTLLLKEKLITIADIIKSKFFYSNREDIRIDIQSGSFTGFLIDKFGIKKIKEIFQYYISPTPEEPVCNIFNIIKKVFNNDIEYLEKLWIDFLLNVEIVNKKYYDLFYNRDYSKKIKKINICKFCYTPLNNKQRCDHCRKDNSINIEYNH